MSLISLPSPLSLGARIGRQLIVSVKELAMFFLSGVLAFELRFDGAVPTKYLYPLGIALCIWAASKTVSFAFGAVNSGNWHQTSVYDAVRIVIVNSVSSVLGAILILLLLGPWGIPRSIYILEWVMSCFIILGVRLAIRAAVIAKNTRWADGAATRTLIYGAGAAGLQLLWELRQNRSLLSEVVGFIDDDPSKIGMVLNGKRVLGTGQDLGRLAKKHAIKRVLIAIPSASGPQMGSIVKLAVEAGVEHKMVPSLGDLIQGKNLDGQIRNVAFEDLLGRKSVNLDHEDLRERINGSVVIVTGAAGSIGAELCRQIAHFNPRALIGFDNAETPLFQIERELARDFPGLEFHPEIGSITNGRDLDRLMEQYRPSVLYHAAAFKHVPMMERHVFAAIENNVLGTWQTALAAMKYGVDDFVMISTDKAVRPTSMMGATKRMAEIAIRSLQKQGRTKFVSVRFGNVLGSNGSVIPIFKEQIASGGPVTVTHPEMRRYFMTIAEAAQLVIQAFSIGRGGEVFLLDMGEPVKIVDLARDLILLSGFRPDSDVKIQFTGLRPGEKLFEELNMDDESLLPTSHSKIRRYACPSGPDFAHIRAHMQELERIIDEGDPCRLLEILMELIPDYTPNAQFLEPISASNSVHADAIGLEIAALNRERLVDCPIFCTSEIVSVAQRVS